MTPIVETHIRKRGFFGWFFLLTFLAFNVVMLAWSWSYYSLIGQQFSEASGPYREAARTGTAIGGALGGTLLILLWVAGSVILGLLALLARGRKTIVIRETPPK